MHLRNRTEVIRCPNFASMRVKHNSNIHLGDHTVAIRWPNIASLRVNSMRKLHLNDPTKAKRQADIALISLCKAPYNTYIWTVLGGPAVAIR